MGATKEATHLKENEPREVIRATGGDKGGRWDSARFDSELTEHPSRMRMLADGLRRIPLNFSASYTTNSYWMLRS